MSDSPAINLARKWVKSHSSSSLIRGTLTLFPELTGVITCEGSLSLGGWDDVVRLKSESGDMQISLSDSLYIAVSETEEHPEDSFITLANPDVWECVFSIAAEPKPEPISE